MKISNTKSRIFIIGKTKFWFITMRYVIFYSKLSDCSEFWLKDVDTLHVFKIALHIWQKVDQNIHSICLNLNAELILFQEQTAIGLGYHNKTKIMFITPDQDRFTDIEEKVEWSRELLYKEDTAARRQKFYFIYYFFFHLLIESKWEWYYFSQPLCCWSCWWARRWRHSPTAT